MNLQELRKRRGEIADAVAELITGGITDENREELVTLRAEAKALAADIATLEEIEAEQRHLAQPVSTNVPTPGIVVGDAPEDRTFESFGEQLSACLLYTSPSPRDRS